MRIAATFGDQPSRLYQLIMMLQMNTKNKKWLRHKSAKRDGFATACLNRQALKI
jgi:hypothetical protein